jgi:hypothetical protein
MPDQEREHSQEVCEATPSRRSNCLPLEQKGVPFVFFWGGGPLVEEDGEGGEETGE